MGSLKALGEALRFCKTSEDLNNINPVIRFLILARICVVFMSIYAVVIGGLIAWIDGFSNIPIFISILIAFTLLHLADNLLNDYSDASRGIDGPGYERLLYAPHPILSGLINISTLKMFVAGVLIYSILLGIYLSYIVSPSIIVLTFIGIAIMLGYSGYGFDLKRSGLGELGVFIVWGPIIIGGTYLALTGIYTFSQALIYTPYGLTVSLVLIGKHLDKYSNDLSKGVYTLPIRIGFENARKLGLIITLLSPALAILGIYLYTGSLTSLSLLPIYISILPSIKAFNRGKPSEKPGGWSIWPLWFAAWGYQVMDVLGRYLIATLIITGLYLYNEYMYMSLAILTYLLIIISDIRNSRLYMKYLG